MSGALPFSGPANQDDPLGLGAQEDAQRRRWSMIAEGLTGNGTNPAFVSGPNYDPQWAAAIGGAKKYGYADANVAPSIAGLMQSTQLGSPYYGAIPKQRRLNPTGLDSTSQTT